MAASQILKNTNATLEVTFSVGNADAGVTVATTRADGTAGPSGSATQIAPAGHYTFTLAPQSELDSLTVTWSGTFGGVAQSVQTFAEIVGGYLFALADARTFGDGALSNTTNYPDSAIRQARERILELFEQVVGYPFVPRFSRDIIDGSGAETIRLLQTRASRVIAASVDGIALTSGDLANVAVRPGSILFRRTGIWNWSFGGQNVIVSYERGEKSAPPDIVFAALTLARYELVSSDISDRMIAFDSDLGQVRLSVPSSKYPTGIPIVDATLSRYTDLMVMVP